MARKSSIHIKLTNEERFELERRARSLTAPHRIVVRAKVILMLAEGQSISGTAVQVSNRDVLYNIDGVIAVIVERLERAKEREETKTP